ncbi:MAG: PqqD family protein [Myxococcaceae bacterium]|nr:PqqD family protein [Myxococcaceae bacterium]
MNAQRTVHHASDAVWRRYDDQVAVISLDASRVRLFNAVGSFLWERCDNATLDQMVAAVRARFDVDEATARADVEGFVDDLVARGLLRPAAVQP